MHCLTPSSIHARNLIDFLYSRSLNADFSTDVIVEDYIDSTTLASHLPPITELLREAKTKANKQVSHLTKDRLEFEMAGKGWQFMRIYTNIMQAFLRISTLFPSQRVTQRFLDQITQKAVAFPEIKAEQIFDQGVAIGLSVSVSLAKGKGQVPPFSISAVSNTKSLE